MPASALSTNSGSPSDVVVSFDHPAIITSAQTVAVVLIRGLNKGIAWHASSPGGADPYANGKGWFCVIGACWTDSSPSGAVDFTLTVNGSSALDLAPPRVSVVAPNGPTRASSFSYRMIFEAPVTGLTSGDFSKSGTAAGCTLGAPSSGDGGQIWTMGVSGCGQGTLLLTLKANAVKSADDQVAGPTTATPAAALLRIDRTKPLNGAPRAGFATGGVLTSKLPVRVSWAAGTDNGGAGVARYEVARSTDSGGTWTSLGTTQKVALDVPTSPSGTLQFRLRAIDWAGNRGAWVKGPFLHPRLVQQTSTNVTFSSGWTTLVSSDYSGGSARQSDISGASARYTFTGRGIAVVMSAAADLGSVKVYVNGSLKATVNTATFSPGDKVVIYQQRFTTVDTRTIRIVSSSGTKPNVILDAFARL